MPKHLRALVSECRRILEADLQNRFRETDFDSAKEAALACLLEVAAIRSFEEQAWHIPSFLSSRFNDAQQYQRFTEERQRLQNEFSFLPQQLTLNAPLPSPKAFKALAKHIERRISPEKWQSDHLLGWLYQSFDAETVEQKRQGRFYTPEQIAGYIVSESLAELDTHEKDMPSVLDLACGAGMFALKAFDLLYRRCRKQTRDGGTIVRNILEKQLFLVDRDPWACRVAALNLYLKAKSLEPECPVSAMNVFCADALRRWEHDGNAELSTLFSTRFDLVLGNPPYIVVNQLKAAKEEILQYKSYTSAAYKINTFALFIERGLELLKPAGTLGMIVPNTLLTQVYFEPLREYILNVSRIAKILDTKRLFDNAFVENCIILLQREEEPVRRRQSVIECLQKETAVASSSSPGNCGRITRIPQHYFEKAPLMMFNVHLDEATFALLEKIACRHPRLGDICESHDGVNPGNVKQKLIVSEQLDEHCRKVLNGKNIGRYRLNWSGLYVRYDRRLLSRGDNVRWGHRTALDSTKILTRQTADRIIGAFDEGDYYVTNSIHTTILRDSAQKTFTLKYVLALLNSKVLSFYYRKQISEAGQLFCQVKLVHLRQLPLKKISLKKQQPFIEDVEELLALERQLRRTDAPKTLQAQIKTVDERLEQKVYALYQLTPEEVLVIEEEFSHFT